MKKRELIISPFALVALTALLWWHLQCHAEYLYYYREQQQIFLNDADYAYGLLGQVGGLSTLITQWLIQFFSAPYAGAAITALLSGLTAGMLWLTLRRISSSLWLLPVVFIPVLLQNVALLRTGYHYEGLVAMGLLALFWWVYAMVSDAGKLAARLLVGCVFVLLLFFYAGSVASLFVLCVCLYDVLKHRSGGLLSLSLLLPLGLSAFVCVSQGRVVGYDYALWLKGYNEYFMTPDWVQHLSWLSIPLAALLFWAGGKVRLRNAFAGWGVGAVLAVAAGWLYANQAANYGEKDFYTLMKLMHHINCEEWDSILQDSDINPRNLLHLNCQNLALSHKGELTDKLFAYPQTGPQSLMAPYQFYNDVNVLFSHIYYRMGVVSETLNMAFGSMIATPNGNPSMLKLLVEERIVFGDYQVAEKYISRLERTWRYARWARDQRRFLYNDEAVNNDPGLGRRRRNLPPSGPEFAVVKGLFEDLIRVLETNPGEQNAREYAIACLLLAKDMSAIKIFVDRHYGTPMLPSLPRYLQEAVISYSENDAVYCREHGVSGETLQRFGEFRQKVLDLRHSNQNQQAGLSAYRDTFWYYLMFTK